MALIIASRIKTPPVNNPTLMGIKEKEKIASSASLYTLGEEYLDLPAMRSPGVYGKVIT